MRMESRKLSWPANIFILLRLAPRGWKGTRMEKPLRGALVLLVFLSVAPYQLWAQMEHRMEQHVALTPDRGNDRLMTDEVSRLTIGITKIKAAASKGSIDAINSELTLIKLNWLRVRTELQVRNETGSIDKFEEAFMSVGESLKTKNKSAIIQDTQALSAAFDNVVESLEKVDVNLSRLFIPHFLFEPRLGTFGRSSSSVLMLV